MITAREAKAYTKKYVDAILVELNDQITTSSQAGQTSCRVFYTGFDDRSLEQIRGSLLHEGYHVAISQKFKYILVSWG